MTQLETRLTVTGMVCDICAARVRRQLLAIDGVKAAEVQPLGVATVRHVSTAGAEALLEAVARAGYEARVGLSLVPGGRRCALGAARNAMRNIQPRSSFASFVGLLVVGAVACADGTLPPRCAGDPGSPAAPEARDVAIARAAPAPAASVVYACPMHPDVTSTAPGVCSRCGMNLVPKTSP